MKCFKYFIVFLITVYSFNVYSYEINKVTYASWDKPDVDLYYVLPKQVDQNTKVIFVIHGSSRDVKKYIRPWLKSIENKNIILIAPHFSSTSYPNYALLEMATSSGKILTDQSKNLTNSISAFFTFFKSKYSLDSNKYRIFGFSGGSQFVHRYLMYGVDTNVERAVMGSAGWYTFLNNEPFPYGTKFMSIDRNRYEWLLSIEMLFLLGEEDNDPNHSSLNTTIGAKKQGLNRYERGVNYFNSMVSFGEKFDMPFRWRYKSVSGLDHDTELMSLNAIPFLIDDLD